MRDIIALALYTESQMYIIIRSIFSYRMAFILEKKETMIIRDKLHLQSAIYAALYLTY